MCVAGICLAWNQSPFLFRNVVPKVRLGCVGETNAWRVTAVTAICVFNLCSHAAYKKPRQNVVSLGAANGSPKGIRTPVSGMRVQRPRPGWTMGPSMGKVAEEPGFEPGLPDPESGVLPLHHSSIVNHSVSIQLFCVKARGRSMDLFIPARPTESWSTKPQLRPLCPRLPPRTKAGSGNSSR